MLASLSACLESCLFDWGLQQKDKLKNCYVNFINNSDHRVYVGALTIASNSELSTEPFDSIFGYLGYVEPYEISEHRMKLWNVPCKNEEDANWKLFFKVYRLKTLEIVVSRYFDDQNKWGTNYEDSLLIGKYSYTLQDLEGDKNYVSITFQ